MKSSPIALGLSASLLGALLLIASVGIVSAQEQGGRSTICDRLSSISRLFPSCNVTPPPPPPGPPAPPPSPTPTPTPAPSPTPPSEHAPSRLCERYLSPSSRGTPPSSCDICPNVNGIQLTGQCADKVCVDSGGTWEGNSCVFPPPDVCPNVPGTQTSGPCEDAQCQTAGGAWNGTSCVMPPPPPPPPPVDECPNVPGDQTSGPCADETCIADGGTWDGTTCVSLPSGSIITEFLLASSDVTSARDGGDNDIGFFTIFFSVEAVGGTVYIAPSAEAMLGSNVSEDIDEHLFRVDHGVTATTSNLTTLFIFDDEEVSVSPNGNIVLADGESAVLTVAVVRENKSEGDTGFYRTSIKGIAWDVVDNVYQDGVNKYNNHNTGLEEYKTEYIFLD